MASSFRLTVVPKKTKKTNAQYKRQRTKNGYNLQTETNLIIKPKFHDEISKNTIT